MVVAFIIWVIAVAAVAIFAPGQLAATALTILGGCVGLLALGLRSRR
jgi:hypothetical protein